jgi:hypothetical protein
MTPNVSDFSFKADESLLESCLYDETSYTNEDPGTQATGRIILNGRDAIVLIPRNPLTAGQSYTVSITANGETITWSFTTVANKLDGEIPTGIKFAAR